MSKKIISLLLAVMLTVSMVAVAAVSVSALTDDQGAYVPSDGTATNRYYFYMPSDWYNDRATTAGIYWWEGTDACASWPGYNAHKSDVNNIYYCDVPDDENIANIIWNNGFDGGEDTTSPDYNKAIQSFNIQLVSYMPGESDKYPDGLLNADGTQKENFGDMIFVVDYTTVTVGDYSGKSQYGGDWYYYYGNGEYGLKPSKDDAAAAGQLYNTEYQPPKPAADPTNPEGETTAPVEDTETTAPAGDTTTPDGNAVPDTEETTAAPKELSLVVNATSNYFPEAVAAYDSEINEVKVTYNLKSAKDVLNAQWTLTYDSDILSLSEKNDPNTVAPVFGTDGSVITLDIKNAIYGNSSNLGLYDFSSEVKPFVSLVFDVNDIADKAPVSTTVNLDVQVLSVSKVGDDLLSSDEEEVSLISGSQVSTSEAAKAVDVDLTTEISPESTVAIPTTQPEPAAGLTVKATSNFFSEKVETFDPETELITVTYYLKSDKDVLDAQWVLSYDPAVLEYSDAYNTDANGYTFMPQVTKGGMYNTDISGKILGSCSDTGLYKFNELKPFVQVTFKPISEGETTVDLQVNALTISKLNPETGASDESQEEIIINKGGVINPTDTLIEVDTTIVAGGTVSTTPESTTSAQPTDSDEITVPEPATDATSTVGGGSTADTPINGGNAGGNGAVQTGDASMALIILSVLLSVTGAMFFARKKIK